MNNTNETMTLQVEAISKFGVLNKLDGKWYNPTKDTVALLKQFKVGGMYDVSITETVNKGKTFKNITAIVSSTVAVASEKKSFVKKSDGETKSGLDWDKKDRAQMYGGRSHDAAELVKASLANATPMSKVLELYKEAFVGILKIAEDVK